MHWFLISLIAPFLWSFLNHTDKYLISKYSNEIGVGGLVVYSSLFAIFIAPVAFFLSQTDVFDLLTSEKIFLGVAGSMYSISILFYLYALEKEDASYVVPFWLLAPVFGFILGAVFLGETIDSLKIIGSIVVLLGAVLLSIEFETGRKIKSVSVVLMIASSLTIALADVIYKKFAEHVDFWPSIFWNQMGMVAFGLICLIFIANYRKSFITSVKEGGKEIATLNIAGETIQSIAIIANNYALMLAPVALVLLVTYTFQPLFVFIEGILLTIFFPKISSENISKKHLIQKGVSILIMALGVYLVLM